MSGSSDNAVAQLPVVSRDPLRASWADAAGFLCFAGFAVWTLTRLPAVGIFLLPTLAHEMFVALAFLVRDRAKASHTSVVARASAYAGTFLLVGFFNAARSWQPEWLVPNDNVPVAAAGALVWLSGSVLAAFAVWTLRYAFSIEPAARQIVTTGPYRIVRHPIYLGYVLQYAGLWLIYPRLALALTLLLWLAVTLVRIHFEEQVLIRTFPGYEMYRGTSSALIPFPLTPRKLGVPIGAGDER